MLKKRIIPLLLYKDNVLIKSFKFNKERVVGSLFETLNVYKFREVDEIIFIDISENYFEPNYALIKEISKETFIPLTVGGKIRNRNQVEKLLKVGVDKVVINTGALIEPNLINVLSEEFGSQCIVVSIDVMKNKEGIYEVFSNSGKNNTGISLNSWLLNVYKRKAGEIIVTDINKDGTMTGYNLDLLNNIPDEINLPIILSGGANSLDNMLDVLSNSKISGVCISSLFHFTELTPRNIKTFLKDNGIQVRI